MVRISVMPKETAQQTRPLRTPGPRRQRMNEFDAYAQVLLDSPDQAVVYEEVGQDGQRFVLSLRQAFKRAGMTATVRKMRGRDEVRVWLQTEAEQATARTSRQRRPTQASVAASEPVSAPPAPPAAASTSPVQQPTPRRGRPKKGATV